MDFYKGEPADHHPTALERERGRAVIARIKEDLKAVPTLKPRQFESVPAKPVVIQTDVF